MTKGGKRNYRIDIRNFLHGIVEHNFKRTEYSLRNGTLKKAKVWRVSEECLLFHTWKVEGGSKHSKGVSMMFLFNNWLRYSL